MQMKTIYTTITLLLLNTSAAQILIPDSLLEDTIDGSMHADSWADHVAELLLQIDKKQNTVYYTADGKETPIRYNELLISDYRGKRKKIVVINQ